MGRKISAGDIFDTWQCTEPLYKSFDYQLITPNAQWETEVKKQYNQLLNRFANVPASLQQLKKLGAHDFKVLRILLASLQENNVPAFIDHLKKIHFATLAAKKEDENKPLNKIIYKYNGMMQLLCGSSKKSLHTKFLYALAQDFFDFCFNPKTFTQCKELLAQSKYHAIIHLMHSVMWINLGSKGWSTWHEKTIERLKTDTRQKREVVYIAGGTDIIQLLHHGIYDIRVIDPFLPTQKTYYSHGWRFLVGGRPKDLRGDTITFSGTKNMVTLQRTGYKKYGTFRATLSNGTKRTLPHSTTTWNIFINKQKPVGTLTIERRFAQQDDFDYDEKKTMLISFNELHFITSTSETSWGIDIKKFHPRFILNVKQLDHALTKSWLATMQKADTSALAFIQLGNCID
jgi:hypothetical protein